MTDRVTRSSAGAVQKRAATEDTASAPSGGPLDIQMMMAAGGNQAMVQLSGEGGGTDQVHAAAAQGIASGGGALPHVGAIQQAFGKHDVSGVQAHTGSAAAAANDAMGANAYATGNHVAFKGAPDLHTAAHEAAHVVQQRGGVALDGGVGKVGDSYEQHADAVADKVVKGESAEGLLDAMGGGGAGGSVQQKAVQREGDGKEDDKGGA
ncbi:MAG: DUF4157 domain-containing protein, partial [Myxococcales bacterium]|nr:DUF4157 domain-containing protein [Myxococcales bacterium]